MGVIMEFAGLPGAGKTTLSLALQQHFKSLKYPVMTRQEAVTTCIRKKNDGILKNIINQFPLRIRQSLLGHSVYHDEFIQHSSCHLAFVSFICHHLEKGDLETWLKKSIWETVIRSFSEYGLISAYGTENEPVIMDEAFVQRCFTLFGYMKHPISHPMVSQYAALAPTAPCVFWIDTSPAVCIDRLKKRYQDRPSPYELESPILLDHFETGRQIFALLCTALKSIGKEVHIIQGDIPIQQALDQLTAVSFPQL